MADPTPSSPPAAGTAEPAGFAATSGPTVMLGDRVEIMTAHPLPEFGVHPAPAFAARLPGGPGAGHPANMVAFVATGGLPIRAELPSLLLSYRHSSLISYRDGGVIDWPGERQSRSACLVYERPLLAKDENVARLDKMYATQQRPLDDEKILTLLRPVIGMLSELDMRGHANGRLHPGNIFLGPHGLAGGLTIGDMASLPPSYDMPPLYLPLERAVTDPLARGMPTQADDMFALGIITLMLKLGTLPPIAFQPVDEILKQRMERGSFSAMVGEYGIKGSTSEMLRGMLEDGPHRRWTIDDLKMWLDGRKPNAHATAKADPDSAKPRRSFTVGRGDEAKTSQSRRGVAWLMSKSPLEAAAAVESGDLMRWIERSIEIEAVTTRALLLLDPNTMGTTVRPATLPDHLAARACMLLDPLGPIRYRGLSIMPGGIGPVLAMTMATGGDVQPIAELINARLPNIWREGQPDLLNDGVLIVQTLDRAQPFLDRAGYGFGMERVLYELMPAQHCLSPLVRNAMPRTMTELMQALDGAAANAGSSMPIDRHVAAFMAARDRRTHEAMLGTLTTPEHFDNAPGRRILGVLALLADAQSRSGPAELKNLAQWLLRLLEPGIGRFHHKLTQARIRKDLNASANSGKLIDMIRVVDDATVIERDTSGFAFAVATWKQAEHDIVALQADIDQRGDVERRIGQPVASAIAVVLGLIASAFAIVFSVWTMP